MLLNVACICCQIASHGAKSEQFNSDELTQPKHVNARFPIASLNRSLCGLSVVVRLVFQSFATAACISKSWEQSSGPTRWMWSGVVQGITQSRRANRIVHTGMLDSDSFGVLQNYVLGQHNWYTGSNLFKRPAQLMYFEAILSKDQRIWYVL